VKPAVVKVKTPRPVAVGAAAKRQPAPDAADRQQQIACAAYYRAEARGFVPGKALADWLEAEAELGERLAG